MEEAEILLECSKSLNRAEKILWEKNIPYIYICMRLDQRTDFKEDGEMKPSILFLPQDKIIGK